MLHRVCSHVSLLVLLACMIGHTEFCKVMPLQYMLANHITLICCRYDLLCAVGCQSCMCHPVFAMQVVTVVARLLWHLVLRKGHALVHPDISVSFENAQMKVCPFGPGASALTHFLRTTAQAPSCQHWITALLKCVT